MHSVQEGMWDPQPSSKYGSPLPPQAPSHPRVNRLRSATPAKRITFYKSGDSQFGGVKMAIHKRSFKCFDALLDDLSQKVPLPFGVRTVTTPHGHTKIKHLDQLHDGGCYLCSDRRQAKPIDMELANKRQNIWYHNNRRSQRPDSVSTTPPGHPPHRQRRILLLKNTEPWTRRTVVLSRKLTRSLRAFMDEASELMQFHVRKLYTAEGRKIDSVQSLMTCPGLVVCVGREPFSPTVTNFLRKSSEEKLPGLGSKSPGLGPRTPGNGAKSPSNRAQSGASEYSEGPDSKRNVNFGLETKKSIIHPRSDSSNRSARFSLSSDKSYVNSLSARPTIMNDDIEKRVVINKDGSLSVEMRVRFRLQGEETLHWSTQMQKAPALNSDCSLSQNQTSYLQHTQSGSCSDPDSFGPDGADEENHTHCCYHGPERHYDLWENPVHSRKHHPVPPPHTSSRTVIRHTHSSSSSSSCNSRRVVRCRAKLTNSERRAGQSKVVQEEMCVTEQVEHRVELEQDGDTRVEVSSVSRNCSHSEVVVVDGNLSRASFEDEVIKKDDECRRSRASTCSQILQSLKDDDDEEDLPPSASQCSQHSESQMEMVACDQQMCPEVSRVSNRSPENKSPNSHASLKDEVSSVVSLHSGTSAVCSNCGGCKGREVDANDNASNVSAISVQSMKTNPLNDPSSVVSDAGECQAPSPTSVSGRQSCTSGKSRCEASGMDEKEGRSPSATSAKSHLSANSNKSLKSNRSGKVQTRERSISPLSTKSSVKSCHSNNASKVTGQDEEEREAIESSQPQGADNDAENEEVVERPISARSNNSRKSQSGCEKDEEDRETGRKSSTSVRSNNLPQVSSPAEDIEQTQGDRAQSATSVKSKRDQNENPEIAVSPMSVKSRSSSKSSVNSKTINSKRVRSATPSSNVITIPTPAVFDEDGNETKSAGSNESPAASEKANHNGAEEEEDLDHNDLSEKQCELLPPTKSPKICSTKLSNTPHQLVANAGGNSRVSSVLSVHSTKSHRSKCSCGSSSAPDKNERETEPGKDENNLDNESDAGSFQKSRRESGATSLNSFGSVSLGLPEDKETADSDSGKSSVLSQRRVTSTRKSDRVGSTVSSKCKRNESKSPSVNGRPTIPTFEAPRAGEEEDSKEKVTDGALRAVSSSTTRSHKSACRYSEKTGSSAKETVETEIKVDPKNREVESRRSRKSGREAKSEVNGNNEDRVHSKCSSSLKPEAKEKREEDNGSTRSVKSPGRKTPNQRVPSARDLNEVENNSKVSKYEPPDGDLSPAFLPNASPSEVVSNWLRSIPTDGNIIQIDDELNENEQVIKSENYEENNLIKEERNVCTEEGLGQQEEPNVDSKFDDQKNGLSPGQLPPEVLSRDYLPKNLQSSAAVMKVLLSSSLGRCQSMPEVSPVYGRRLSTSAKGLLDCLAQLQLTEPALGPAYDQRKGCNPQFQDIIAILQSLWLAEPRDADVKGVSTDQVSPPRSSSGVGMSSGSGGSGKENETSPKEEECLPENKVDRVDKMESGAFSESLETKEEPVNQAAELPDESGSVLHAPLCKRMSQDPDPVWVLHLLRKLEKQFLNHYNEAMEEFKVRWDLDDSLILDKMITELKQEVKHRVQNSVDREMKKIQGRAGKVLRSPRPPDERNLSRDPSMTDKRRRILKVMKKNQSVKTADSLSDGDTSADLSDQRSEEEYCPCDACVRKKLDSQPLKTNPMAVDAPVQMQFDLLKILQLKKAPAPAPSPPPASPSPESACDSMGARAEGWNLDVVEEEEEEEEEEKEEKAEQGETKEDIVPDLVLEETIPEEDEGEETERKDEEKVCSEGNECEEQDVSGEDTEKCEDETPGEEVAVEGDQSSLVKDEDDDDDTEEGETEEQKKQVMEEENDPDKRHDTSIEASHEEEPDKQGDGDDEEEKTEDDVQPADESTDEKREEVLHHQLTRTSLESQPGSLEALGVDSDPPS